jgi:hypothetical protein
MLKERMVLLILFVMLIQSIPIFSQDRGVRLVVKTKDGKKIELYKGAYAFIVGNGEYKKGGWIPLPGALKDVDEVKAALIKIGYNKVILIKDLKNRESFVQAFTEFVYEYGQSRDNQLLFYYAGHGYTERMSNDEEMGYLVMVDAPSPESDPIGFKLAIVDMQFIVTQAKMIKAKHVLFVFDSCFSGTILNFRSRVVPELISDNVKYPVRQFITAGRAKEKVPDRSVFKQAFLDLLKGKDKEPMPDGYITGEEMGLYLKQKVPQYNPRQHPQYGKINDPKLDKGDFVFLSKRGYESPPTHAGINFSELEIEAKWSKWQKIFENDVDKAKEFEKNSGISASSKKSTWEMILNTYSQNNQYSDKDEQLRNYAKERIRYWKRISEDKSGDHAHPAYEDKPAVIKSVGSIANRINEKDKESPEEKPAFTITQSKETRAKCGVRMPVSIQVDGINLVLNGMALRKMFIFKVYVVGLYLPQKDSDPENILNADQPRQIVKQYLRSISAIKLAESLPADASPALRRNFDSLNNYMENVKTGDVVIYTYLPGKGMEIKVKGKTKGRIIGKDFADALFAKYIGPTSIYGVSKALLGK